MKKYSVIITSSIISVLFILLTGWISFSHTISVLFDFTFVFHIIPFGIGFAGGASILIFVYYFFLWLALSLLISPIVRAFYSSKNKIKFLTFSITPLILITVIVAYIDYSVNKEREERVAINQKKDKADFSHLKTGDLLFQRLNKDSVHIDSQNSDNTYNNIGIAFIDGQNYGLLETKDQVQYVSIRQWVENGNSEHYVAKRLKNGDSLLHNNEIQKLEREARNNIMKKYDSSYDWSDDKMYNAELVWKIYKRSLNVELGELDTLKSDSIMQFEITPDAIYNSENLMTIKKR